MAKNQVLFVADIHSSRPANIPASWTIYNAPRPICGHKTWQADFRHGVFYAAICPAGDPTDEFNDVPHLHERNRQLDAHVCVWVSQDQIMDYGQMLAREYNIDISKFNFDDILASFEEKFHSE